MFTHNEEKVLFYNFLQWLLFIPSYWKMWNIFVVAFYSVTCWNLIMSSPKSVISHSTWKSSQGGKTLLWIMWHDWRYKPNTAFTFHKTHTGSSLESFYKVKGDAAQQKEPLWEAEQFSGIKKQLLKGGLVPGHRVGFLIAFLAPFGSEVGEPPQGFVLPFSTQGWAHSQNRENLKQNPFGVRNGNEWISGCLLERNQC